MQPPRKGALPYTREEYRALPDDRKSAALDFIIEGIIPGRDHTGDECKVQSDMGNIVEWCIQHGEDMALEFLFRQSGAIRIPCFGQTLDRRAVALMRPALQSNPQVRLDLMSVVVAENAASDLAELVRDGRVARLGIWCGSLGDQSMLLIANALQSNTTVTVLHLHDFQTRNENVAESLAVALAKNMSITGLSLSSCNFGTHGWVLLLEAFGENRYAKELTLTFCGIESEESAVALGELLANATKLETFTIWIDKFDRIAWDVLGGLGRNRSIKEANITAGDNVLNHTGEALRDCLARNTVMERLQFETGVPIRCPDTLAGNTSLRSLQSNFFTLNEEEEDIVASTLQRNNALANDAYVNRYAAILHEMPDHLPY